MRFSLFIGCVFAVVLPGFAQTDTLQPLLGGEALTFVEDPPRYSGGENAMNQFLAAHIRYPVKAREAGKQGTVVVKYVVDIDSTLRRIHIIQPVGGGCDEEVIRIIRLMSDSKLWIPGTFNGRPVPIWYSLPVKFALQSAGSLQEKVRRG